MLPRLERISASRGSLRILALALRLEGKTRELNLDTSNALIDLQERDEPSPASQRGFRPCCLPIPPF
jgi:hypothetical protein